MTLSILNYARMAAFMRLKNLKKKVSGGSPRRKDSKEGNSCMNENVELSEKAKKCNTVMNVILLLRNKDGTLRVVVNLVQNYSDWFAVNVSELG